MAESLLAGTPIPIELESTIAVPTAVGLATQGAPLLVDPTTVALIDAVRDGIDGRDLTRPTDPLLANAFDIARSQPFGDAVRVANGDPQLAPLVGAFVGLDGGLGAIPARLVSTFNDGTDARGRRYLRGLTNRLLEIGLPNWYDPRRRRGPKEVLPGLWLANLYGLDHFVAAHPDGLVLSLCDDEGRLSNYPNQVSYHLEDTPRAHANPSLGIVVDEILGEIDAARRAGQPVLAHCRHGASRTGLILRALLVDEQRLSAEASLIEAQCLWSHTSDWNREWTRELERRADAVEHPDSSKIAQISG